MDDDILDITGGYEPRGIANEIEGRRGGCLDPEAANDQDRFFYCTGNSIRIS